MCLAWPKMFIYVANLIHVVIILIVSSELLNILRCVCDIMIYFADGNYKVNALIRRQTEEVDKFSPHFLLEDKISGIIG